MLKSDNLTPANETYSKRYYKKTVLNLTYRNKNEKANRGCAPFHIGANLIKSHYTNQIDASMDGKEVTLAGWVNEIRETSKVTFLILRDMEGTAQVIGKKGVTPEDVIKRMALPKESVVLIKGIVSANTESKYGYEIIARDVEDLNPISTMIPFEVTGKVPAEIDVRLDNRHVDLRRKEPSAIFNIESTIIESFVGITSRNGFRHIRTPSIIEDASEGGAEVFKLKYFEREAFLAQSPQLYKQLAVIGGIEKVAMVMPAFRAEKSNTTSHLTEITQMDVEIAFADADDAISILIATIKGIIEKIIEKNGPDLEKLGIKLISPEAKIVTYENAVKSLSEKGYKIETGEDFSRENELAIYEIFGDAVVVKDYPTKVRAFYSMPKKDNPEISESYDYIYKGVEISSGAKRINDADMLIRALRSREIDTKPFDFYINAFRCGAPPHAGWSIGMERLAMQITGAKNIRECSMFPRDRKRLVP